jgi:CubicO group peptidase (beta-lactamase class C family)
MKRLFFYPLILVFALQISVSAQRYEQAIQQARFLVTQHQQLTNLPAVQIAVMVEGEMIWSEAFGYRDLENNIKASTSTQFRIASLSKPVTSLALGQLMANEQLDLDRDIRDYLPNFPKKRYPLTARQLAGSTSGIRHYQPHDPTYRMEHYETVNEALRVFQDSPLEFEPNTQYGYSSYGWVLLSAVMEKAAGLSFFTLMEETWSAMGLKNTSFDYPYRSKTSQSYYYVPGKKGERAQAPTENRSFMYAGGGYLSTAEDLVTMGYHFLKESFLPANIVDTLTTSLLLKDGNPTHYGLGWEIGQNRLGTEVWFHGGNLPTARSHWVIFPEEDIVLAYLCNTGQNIFFNEREAHTLAEIFLQAKKHKGQEKSKKESILGEWAIQTTSLRGKKTKGTLNLYKEGALICGKITFRRSRKVRSFPIIYTGQQQGKLQLTAVTPMFADFFIEPDEKTFTGYWLHDFDVKGIGEQDDYWLPRTVSGFLKKTANY